MSLKVLLKHALHTIAIQSPSNEYALSMAHFLMKKIPHASQYGWGQNLSEHQL